ncbi:exosortase V [Tsuneonella amylolytica]|uniref:exosortase V n=1 Tax=Tsuneonella amylolytica TaxID=2338327 RepID=UPI000EAA9D8D|nr:exosortase V [Tsuneonella amylolytica]
MATSIISSEPSRNRAPSGPLWSPRAIVLALAVAIFAIPTMIFVIRVGWSGEEGAHGPIVLSTGLWLLWQQWRSSRSVVQPPSWPFVWIALAVLVPLTVFARITEIVEIEGYLMYASLIVVMYSLTGLAAIKRMWFPLVYLAFIFPPPDTIVYAVTIPMKMWLSKAAIGALAIMDYPIAGEGVRIYIGQYELLVAAACSGINSIISLSAISLFYIYMRHQAEWRYALLLVLLIVPVALAANFVRVIILILLTYHYGEAAAQGFLHNFAGILLFAVALVGIFLLDAILHPIFERLRTRRARGFYE